MRLKFNNIGIIKDADILIDGLTILAGVNDTGKSTVGKLLYSIIKVVNNYQKVLKKNQIDALIMIFDELIEEIKERNSVNLRNPNSTANSLEEETEQSRIRTHSASSEDFINQLEVMRKDLHERSLNNYVNKGRLTKIIKETINQIAVNETNLKVNEYFDRIDKINSLSDNSFEVKKAAFDLMIDNEFKNQINNSGMIESSNIEVIEEEHDVINLMIKDNEIADILALKSSSITDVTYIDTPFQLQDYSISELMSIKSGMKLLKKHSIDLITKLYDKHIDAEKDVENIIFEIERKEKTEKFEKIIKKIIGGDIVFSQKVNNFIYQRNGDEYRLVNTATGIRAFAIIKLLLTTRNLNKSSILIIDEPEVHLHPQWQINYAELLVRMVKELKLKVLITSHSTYMIEAFKIYSDHYGISDTTNFYLMKKKNKYSEAKLVNNQLNVIYEELSNPYSKLDDVLLNDFDK
jgi:predicted ATPase